MRIRTGPIAQKAETMTWKATGQFLRCGAIVAAFFIPAAPPATAGTPWGWSLPLNQKPGSLLYTTNRYAKRRSSRSRGISATAPRYGYDPGPAVRRYATPVYRTPVYRTPTRVRVFRRR